MWGGSTYPRGDDVSGACCLMSKTATGMERPRGARRWIEPGRVAKNWASVRTDPTDGDSPLQLTTECRGTVNRTGVETKGVFGVVVDKTAG